jgi:hypothetical protein
MTCQEFWSRIQESRALLPQADGTPADRLLLEHVHDCPCCGDLMKRHRALQAGLRHIAAEQAGLRAPGRVEAALLRDFRAHADHPHAPARAGSVWWATLRGRTVAAALATAGLAAVLAFYSAPLSRVWPASPSEAEDAAYLDSGFVPLPYAGGAAPNADGAVVRVEVPGSTLVALGVALGDQITGGTVEAELLLGPGGMPQAVRVIE